MKTPFDELNILNYLTEEENAKLFWGHRLFGNKSKILTTADLATFYKKAIDTKGQDKIFNYFKLKFLFLVLILSCVIFLIIFSSFYHKEGGKTPYVLTILFVLFMFSLISLQFFGRQRIFKISLSRKGILIKETFYKWSEIEKIYIIERPKGNQRFYYLVLALDTGIIRRYDFTNLMNFNAFHIKLSAYIEHYKNFA